MNTQDATKTASRDRSWKHQRLSEEVHPKKAYRNDMGMNITVTIVSVFMMSFVRLETTER